MWCVDEHNQGTSNVSSEADQIENFDEHLLGGVLHDVLCKGNAS
jgi:hypothetical protein